MITPPQGGQPFRKSSSPVLTNLHRRLFSDVGRGDLRPCFVKHLDGRSSLYLQDNVPVLWTTRTTRVGEGGCEQAGLHLFQEERWGKGGSRGEV